MSDSFNSDRRAVTFSIEYALTALIAIGLLGAIPTVFGGVADSTQEDVQQAEFDRIAGEVAAAVDAIDHQYDRHEATESRTGITGASLRASVRPDIPARVDGRAYQIRVRGGKIIVEPPSAGDASPRGTAPLLTELDVTSHGGTHGGAILVEFDPDTTEIVIKPDAAGGEIPTEVGADA
ncbi:hypothetical protein ACFQDD_00935 [Halorubrum pallidum]|uniref:Uncharacterized protein n=1 Tax=Halorubrum pallidum TaxID=1526114 RepID=A0ABD5SXZ6_9EURY